MCKRWYYLLLLIFSLVFSLPSSAEAEEIITYAKIRSGELKIIFRFAKGKEDWVAPLVTEAPRYISLVERYMGSPFYYHDYIIIKGCAGCGCYMDGHVIHLDYSYQPTSNPAVLFHEINHYWFYYYNPRQLNEWFIEGVASFLPVAMGRAGYLPNSAKYTQLIDFWWGMDTAMPDNFKDLPLHHFKSSNRSVLYNKSYRLQYLIHCLLGPGKYRRFLQTIAKKKRSDLAFVIKTLNRLKRHNWKRFFKGWVLGSTYKEIPLKRFWQDPDFDGLSSAREFCAQTNKNNYDSDGDELPDGAEVSLRTNPRVPNSNASALIDLFGPFIDGNELEWIFLEQSTHFDSTGDVIGEGWADMSELSYRLHNNALSLKVKTAGQATRDSAVFFDVLVDSDFDGLTDNEFAFFLKYPNNPWRYNYDSNSTDAPTGLKTARGAVIEISIPLSSISSNSFQILPIIRNDITKLNYDEWGSWVPISH